MAKIKLSHTIDEELVTWLNSEIETKRFASISHGIEYALTAVKGMQNQSQTKPKPKNVIEESAEILAVVDIETARQKWWDDKQIGMGIIKAGGIGLINLTNIIQKNPYLFETKDECRSWLQNKLITDPPIIDIETPPPTRKLHPKIPVISSADPTDPPKFTPNRSTAKCPGCEEEHLEIPGSTIQKCPNCGYIKQSNQQAPMQDIPPSPPLEAEQ